MINQYSGNFRYYLDLQGYQPALNYTPLDPLDEFDLRSLIARPCPRHDEATRVSQDSAVKSFGLC